MIRPLDNVTRGSCYRPSNIENERERVVHRPECKNGGPRLHTKKCLQKQATSARKEEEEELPATPQLHGSTDEQANTAHSLSDFLSDCQPGLHTPHRLSHELKITLTSHTLTPSVINLLANITPRPSLVTLVTLVSFSSSFYRPLILILFL